MFAQLYAARICPHCRWMGQVDMTNTRVLSVVKEMCIGSGMCVESSDAIFRFDGDGLAEVYADTSTMNSADLRAFVDACPASAIKIDTLTET
jgi:ferredoxin